MVLTFCILLQSLLHPCFVALSGHLKVVLNWSNAYSLEITILPKMTNFHLQFWQGQSLVDDKIARLPPYVPFAKGELTPMAQLQSARFVKPHIISCGGCMLMFQRLRIKILVVKGVFTILSVQNVSTSKSFGVCLVTTLWVVLTRFGCYRSCQDDWMALWIRTGCMPSHNWDQCFNSNFKTDWWLSETVKWLFFIGRRGTDNWSGKWSHVGWGNAHLLGFRFRFLASTATRQEF